MEKQTISKEDLICQIAKDTISFLNEDEKYYIAGIINGMAMSNKTKCKSSN